MGGSYTIKKALKLNVSYEGMKLLGRDSTSLDGPMARYDGYAHMVGMSLSVDLSKPN
jgi:hypothetical protein